MASLLFLVAKNLILYMSIVINDGGVGNVHLPKHNYLSRTCGGSIYFKANEIAVQLNTGYQCDG